MPLCICVRTWFLCITYWSLTPTFTYVEGHQYVQMWFQHYLLIVHLPALVVLPAHSCRTLWLPFCVLDKTQHSMYIGKCIGPWDCVYLCEFWSAHWHREQCTATGVTGLSSVHTYTKDIFWCLYNYLCVEHDSHHMLISYSHIYLCRRSSCKTYCTYVCGFKIYSYTVLPAHSCRIWLHFCMLD